MNYISKKVEKFSWPFLAPYYPSKLSNKSGNKKEF